MPNNLNEQQQLLSTHRQVQRPKYYSPVAGTFTTISYEFETYVILLDRSTKQNIITRLRKAAEKSGQSQDRDLLALQAADYEGRATSAISADLALDIGDYSSFSTNELQGSRLPEVAQLVSDLGTSIGPILFQRDQSDNEQISVSMAQDDIKSKSTAKDRKRQLESWINVFITYMTA